MVGKSLFFTKKFVDVGTEFRYVATNQYAAYIAFKASPH